ncbi:MAG: tetratricopeptide repeat protein [Pirellulales bacterium]|nr:tetratricopeptide repeat protein [Pirellulales bacterium]
MLRWILVVALTLVIAALLLSSGWLPPMPRAILRFVFQTTLFVIIPVFLVAFLMAPGMFPSLANEARALWQRFSGREVSDLRQKIDQLDKPHHMVQLGNIFLRAARFSKAKPWYEKALQRDSTLLEARYKLALCQYHLSEHTQAMERLEQVHAEKADYDYGMAYLRLAQVHARLDNHDRAAEVFAEMLRFYPGHAEASYSFGLLLSSLGQWSEAHHHMRNVNATLRQSPPFQRRRNRHWAIKSWWWLLRFGNQKDGTSEHATTVDSSVAQELTTVQSEETVSQSSSSTCAAVGEEKRDPSISE